MKIDIDLSYTAQLFLRYITYITYYKLTQLSGLQFYECHNLEYELREFYFPWPKLKAQMAS